MALLSADRVDAMMVKIPLERLVQESDVVLVGRVESVESEKRGAVIVSLARIKVERTLKGKPSPQEAVVVEFQGGRIGGEVLRVEDSPDYQAGEEVVAFLRRQADRRGYVTTGHLQGKYVVRQGRVEGENVSLERFLERLKLILLEKRQGG